MTMGLYCLSKVIDTMICSWSDFCNESDTWKILNWIRRTGMRLTVVHSPNLERLLWITYNILQRTITLKSASSV